ncbi:MAG: A24 family peptidase [Phototrophicaceae bacterium]
MLEVIVAVIIGLLVGILINILADELPYRTFFRSELKPPKDATKAELAEYSEFNRLLKQRNKRGYLPVYPDGTPRPIATWLGLAAFILGKRLPDNPQPDEVRSRGHREDEGWTLSWRHPLTEIMTAFFFGLAAYRAGSIVDMNSAQYMMNFIYMAFFSLIIAIDMEHKLILFVVMIPAILLAVFDAYFISPPLPNFQDALIGAALGFGVFFAIYILGYVFRWVMNTFAGRNIRTVAFGYGDVLMITFTGAMLGTLYTVVAIALTTLLGAIGAILYLLVKAIVSRTNASMNAIPYGPYIVIATLIMQLWGSDVYRFFTT